MTTAPQPPLPRLALGITGHRASNAAYAAHREAVETRLEALFDEIEALLRPEADGLGSLGPVRLHSLLAGGIDQHGAASAVRRGWDLVAPLPFGRLLNRAVNAEPATIEDARALLRGEEPADPAVAARAAAIRGWEGRARLFELAEGDAALEALWLAQLAEPGDVPRALAWSVAVSERAACAGRVMIEQSDLLIAVWDGAAHNFPGGTGHTIAAALERACPVVWIDPARPREFRVLHAPEALESIGRIAPGQPGELAAAVRTALRPGEGGALRRGAQALGSEAWHDASTRLWHGYRRIEALFGGQGKRLRSLVQSYETPDAIATGTGAPILAAVRDIAPDDPALAEAIEQGTLRRFAWADGISARLSDAYRGGMVANFLLSILAVGVGLAYQPLHLDRIKWLFAVGEFALLATIIAITTIGIRRRWHRRWFETRRVAEYFRHAPILQALGVARPAGRWPKGSDTNWPEYYARHGLRAAGLPQTRVDGPYLRRGLTALQQLHVRPQRDYHLAKAFRLETVHHRLDKLSARLFQLAVASVSLWLVLAAAAYWGVIDAHLPTELSKLFTFLGVMFPTIGAGIAGIRYFGDFERFAAISQVTAEKLEAIDQRIAILLRAEDAALGYDRVSDLAHAVDSVVVDEIESWQAVFSGKHISVPV